MDTSVDKKDPTNTPRARARLRSRRLRVSGLLISVAVAVGVAGVLGPFGGLGLGPGAPHPANTGHGVVKRSAVGPVPTALDAEWAAYSDRSTCADWAGGDGISAVRLSAVQIAWFFSDSYLGPATPSAGFSHSAGLVHNSAVIQTRAGQGNRFVTLTGGGLCSSAAAPTAVVSPRHVPGTHGEQRYWDEDGIEVGATVVKFYNR